MLRYYFLLIRTDQLIRTDKTQKVTYRCLKAINIINLNKDLADSSLCYYSPDDIDHLAECYETTLASVIDRQAPLKSKVFC